MKVKGKAKFLIEVIKPPFKPYGKRKRKKLYIAGFFIFFYFMKMMFISLERHIGQIKGTKTLSFFKNNRGLENMGIVPERL
jgi:hypothetical protein